jgi:hypothetical protein
MLEFLSAVGYFSSSWTNVLKVGPYALDCYNDNVGFTCRYVCNSDKMPLSAIGHFIRRIIEFVSKK